MNIFFNLAGYEFKKVIWRKRTFLVLLIVLLLSAVSVFGTVMGKIYYPDPDGGAPVYVRILHIIYSKNTVSAERIIKNQTHFFRYLLLFINPNSF